MTANSFIKDIVSYNLITIDSFLLEFAHVKDRR